MGTVGSVTVGVKADSSEFQADMAKNQATINQFARSAQAGGQAAAGGMRVVADQSVIVSQGLAASTTAAAGFATAVGMIRTALLTAFPLAGALALLDVLEKIADNKFQKAAVELGDSFRTMNLAAETSIDTLKLSTAKMQEQIDLLSGKRPNTLAEDLANAALAADRLASSLDADNRKIAQLLEQQRLGGLQGLLTDRAGTADVEGSINSFDEDLAHLAAKYQHSVRTGSPDADADLKALDDKRLAAMRWQSDQLEQRKRLQAQGVGPNQDANIAVLTGFGDTLVNQADLEADEKINKATAGKLKQMEDDKKYAAMMSAAQKKAQEELLKQDEEDEKKRNAFNKLSINEEIQFWTDRIGAFTRGSDQYIQVQNKIDDLIARRPSLFAENKKNQASVGKSQVEGENVLSAGAGALRKISADEEERSARSLQRYYEEVARGIEIQQRAATTFAESSVQLSLMQGTISKLEAATALAAIHEDDHAKAIERVNTALAEQIRLINAQPDDKVSAAQKADEVRNARQSAANQRAAINGTYDVQRAADKAGISGDTISGAVRQALNEMVQNFNDMAASLKNVLPRTIESLNSDIARLATGQGRKGDFGHTLSNAGEGLVKAGLQRAEGGLLNMLGLGKSSTPGSSPANPIYTINVGAGGGALGGGLSGGILGGALGHIPGVGTVMKGGVGDFFSSFLQGHFAAGGDVLANYPAMVGERGPEMFVPHAAGRIVPNHQLGSGDTHNTTINVTGNQDPMAVHAAVTRALPHAVAASVQANHQAKMRSPGGR